MGKLRDYFASNPKISFKSGCLIIILIFGGTIALGGLLANILPKTKPVPVRSDKELFISFYHKFMAKTEEADLIFDPFRTALQKGDILGATQIAMDIKYSINSKWGEISRIKTPDLQNQEAKKKLDQAQESISNAYLYRSSMVRDYVDYTDEPSIKKMAELKTTAENISLLSSGGIAYLADAANLVGVKLADLK